MCSLQAARPVSQQAPVQAAAPPGVFADSPDCLDDLDIDHLVSTHQQQAAKQQPVQHAGPATHAACSITQTSQRLPLVKPGSHSLSLLGASSATTQRSAGAAAAAAQLPAARPALADVLHASAAPRASAPVPEAATCTPSSPVRPAPRAGLAGQHAAPCGHGVPMQQCRHKQDHLNQVNADLVKILLGERPAQPGEQDRLKALKKTIEECIEMEDKDGPSGLMQHSAAPAAAVDAHALGKQIQHSIGPSYAGSVEAGVESPAYSYAYLSAIPDSGSGPECLSYAWG